MWIFYFVPITLGLWLMGFAVVIRSPATPGQIVLGLCIAGPAAFFLGMEFAT